MLLPACVLLCAAGLTAAQETQQPNLRPRRLYFGAPPAAPHELGSDMADCLACHATADLGAPQTPHPERVRCQQCHVEAGEEKPSFRASRFAGLERPGRMPRVQANAPPVMAHAVLLHENCLACHGPDARRDVLATSHPERSRCQQCHIPQRAKVAPFPARR